ncbi:MAG: GerMN domain-containing protein [Clostridiales bacterium]|jgi:hypothetical protein|nr:GerMN domain-containing protein [Clostridiales bacterium]
MKRILLTALAAMFLLTSCGGADNNPETPTETPAQTSEPATDTILDYFPIRTNTNYHYESPANPELTQDIYVTYTGGSRVQRRAASDKVSSTEVLQYQNGELKLVYGEPNFYFYEDLTAVEPILDMLLLKEPLEQGRKWSLDAAGESEITGLDINVSTPSGDYSALEVATVFTDGRRQKEYYAKGAGLVKTVYTMPDNSTFEIDLASITEQASLIVPVDFFYPDAGSETGYGKEEREVTLNTNSGLASIFTEQMKAAGASGYVWLPGETRVNSIDVDRVNNLITVDLSDNNGVGTEEGLRMIADTLGHFYGASKVRPTVNGGDYTAAGKTYGQEDFITVTVEADQAVIN